MTVPAGPFLMGSTQTQAEAAAANFAVPLVWCLKETPQHSVSLEAFRMSRAPITCAEYRAFVVATDHTPPAYWGSDEPPAELLDHPVVTVTWSDARSYCRWLSTATEYSFRLPSEAEWEKAARGGDGRIFPWGDRWEPGCCNIAAGGAGATSMVGSYPQDTSPYGCVDLAGNVEEWTASMYTPYLGSSQSSAASMIVVRGGRWDGGAELARCARRHDPLLATSSLARGFRVVCIDE